MKKLIVAVALAAGWTFALTSPAFSATKSYDCTKAGNANKVQCRNAAQAALKAAKPAKSAPAAKPASTKVSSTTTTRTVTQKSFDCTKAGNANKAVCRTAATSPAKPVAKQTTIATTSRHYDCTKAGNASKQECKVSAANTQGAPKTIAASKASQSGPTARPSTAQGPARTTTSKASDNNNPAGAIAQCKDGTYSHSKSRSGTCSRHGGVAKWS